MALSAFALLLITAVCASMMADHSRSFEGAVALKLYGLALGVATVFALAYAAFGVFGLLTCSLVTGAVMERR